MVLDVKQCPKCGAWTDRYHGVPARRVKLPEDCPTCERRETTMTFRSQRIEEGRKEMEDEAQRIWEEERRKREPMRWAVAASRMLSGMIDPFATGVNPNPQETFRQRAVNYLADELDEYFRRAVEAERERVKWHYGFDQLKADAAERENERLRGVLREVEFGCWINKAQPCCALCESYKDEGHADDCPIGRALAQEGE